MSGYWLLLLIALSIGSIIWTVSMWKWHPFISLLAASLLVGLGSGLPLTEVLAAVNSGFGQLLAYIGLVVVLGSIIGVILERSGAAQKIAELILGLLGQGRPVLAMTLIGATVSIPVFCDSGFIILSGLNDALARRTAFRKGQLALALATGLYTTHTLIPPTPGPIAAAGNLGAADYLGWIILLGLVVAVPVLIVAWQLSRWRGHELDLPLKEEVTVQPEQLPSALAALLPVLLPILLIALGTITKFSGYAGTVSEVLITLGNPVVALLLGLVAALFLLPEWDQEHLQGWPAVGIQLAGPILIITGAGGAFGAVLKATSLQAFLTDWLSGQAVAGSGVLIVGFALAALLKTAQGSSTNALVITSGLLAPIVGTLGMNSPTELALLVLSLGGGAMCVSHSNDSYFWVVSQFSGIRLEDAYRSFTLITLVQGLTVLLLTLLLYALLV
ncbi:MAG: GntP family permease [Bacteroidota bacterium]